MAAAKDGNTRYVWTDEETSAFLDLLSCIFFFSFCLHLFICSFYLYHHVALSSSAVIDNT